MNKSLSIKDELTNFLLYTTPNGNIKVEVFLHDENLWLNQKKIAELFGVEVPTINYHIKQIYESGELRQNSTIRKFLTVQKEGDRDISREIEFYNLDMIISIGYRVNSSQATQFRIWATERLKEYIIKGFSLDDERMKNGKYFGKDYFQELLERIRSIRTSERRLYQKITDIFAECSVDYDPNSDITKNFYAMIQNKFHFAITGKTASEIIYEHANAKEVFMGLKTWKNSPKGRILKSDSIIAKNYLQESKIKKLERSVSGFFDYLETLVENHTPMKMEDLAQAVDNFLQFNKYKVLEGKGGISRKQAEDKAFAEYKEFNKIQSIESDFDRLVKQQIKLENK
ncbi:MAG: virulence RhuM family protein [Candidatus Absconditabacteria bacterium]|nr:virulence RhuM family protein [Candidatus Absconditabacteria bacterium]